MFVDKCPACDTAKSNSKLFLRENYDENKLSSFSYSSRKIPEYMNYELRICNSCDLVYSIAPITSANLIKAYQDADYDSSEEARAAAKTYATELCKLIKNTSRLETALEIGAGNGAFLAHLKTLGIRHVIGIEPSLKAIAMAAKNCRENLISGEFRAADFSPESFDLICCFMTLEHVFNPKNLIEEVYSLLKPNGYFVCVTHDYESPINRVLGKNSPIIDVEHLQLFCRRSINQLLSKTGFLNIKTSSFCNQYPIGYWLRLLPIPATIKSFLIKNKLLKPLMSICVSLNVGNQISIGQKIT